MTHRYWIWGIAGGVLAMVGLLCWQADQAPDGPPVQSADAPVAAHVAAGEAMADRVGEGPGDGVEASIGVESARLAEAYASTRDGVRRERMLRAAARLGQPEAVVWLAQVASEDEQMGAHAAAALGSTASPEAAATLSRLAAGSAPVIVRANAARALGTSGSHAQAETLAALAADGAQPLRVRQEAALSLTRVGTPAVVPALAGALEAAAGDDSTEGEQLRIALVRALGAIDAAEAQAALARHAERDLSKIERTFLARAMRSRAPVLARGAGPRAR